MGVEYRHFLIPEDPCFVASSDAFYKVNGVLKKWKLIARKTQLFDITEGINIRLDISPEQVICTHGIAMLFDDIQGSVIADIFGPSYFGNDIKDEDRYVENLLFISGTDYRIHPEGDSTFIEITAPPKEEYDVYPKAYFEGNYIEAEAYSTSLSASPPEVRASVLSSPGNITKIPGYWRTAFVIYFGKDLPKGEPYSIYNKEFLADIEAAIGCRVVNIGQYC